MADETNDTTGTQNSEMTPGVTTDTAITPSAAAAVDGVTPAAPAADPLDAPGLLDDVKAGEEKPGTAEDAKEGEGDGEAKPGADADAPLIGEAPETYAITAPEGTTLDAAALEMFDPVFRKLGLTDAGAQALVDQVPAYLAHVQAKTQEGMVANIVATRKEWADAAAADPEIGGAKFEESKSLAAKVFDRFGLAPDGAFRTLLKESGLGNHADMIRVFAKIGRAIGEDGFDRGEAGKGDVPIWDKVYGGPTPTT